MSKKFTITENERIRLEALFGEVHDDLKYLISGPMTDVLTDFKLLCRQFPPGAHIAGECRQIRSEAYAISQDLDDLLKRLQRIDLESLVNDEA